MRPRSSPPSPPVSKAERLKFSGDKFSQYELLQSNLPEVDTLGPYSRVRSGEVSDDGRLKPWPKGVSSNRKFENVNLGTQTCDG